MANDGYIGAPEDRRGYYLGDEEPPEDNTRYGLKLTVYDGQVMDMWVFAGAERMELTLEEALDAQTKWTDRNPKGSYAVFAV